jgi:glycosyltransferase involved in cell wall biosynthesis
MHVTVCPDFRPTYYAFYLEGIRYSRHGFPDRTQYNDGFAFEVQGPGPHRRIYISASDHARLDQVALDWCDRYGMVNYDPQVGWQELYPKVLPIGPSFGSRSWGWRSMAQHALKFYLPRCASLSCYVRSVRAYKNQLLDRVPETDYVPGLSRPGYVFYVSWPWKKHPEANPPRERFIRACRSISWIEFEGGFAPRRRRDVPGIEEITAPKRYPLREYLRKTKQSSVVFNNPAVHLCLGWKFGEFLALGKAIISAPLSRAMPAPLTHGRQVHFTNDSVEAMREAVETICGDHEYRQQLELGARAYYVQHLEPSSVIRRLCGFNDLQ